MDKRLENNILKIPPYSIFPFIGENFQILEENPILVLSWSAPERKHKIDSMMDVF
jgi:hypothetical protein